MKPYKRVLVAVDFNEMEKNPIIERANLMSQSMGATLFLIHTVEELYTYGAPLFSEDLSDWQEEFLQTAKEKLQVIGNFLNVSPSHQYIKRGSPREEILELATEIDSDLIIIGSHRKEGFSSLFLGSSAHAVVQGATCDVLIIRTQKP